MLTGSCQCGEIAYESSAKPSALYICHCLECQKQSASAFGISLYVPRSGFSLTRGKPNYWSRITANGKLTCAFCDTCGSRLWHESSNTTEIISIKGGSLNQPLDISQAIHVWVKRKLPGVIIQEDAKQFLEEEF